MTKVCKVCENDLPLDKFYQQKVKNYPDRIIVAAICRSCANEKRQKWRKENPEQVKVHLERSKEERRKVRQDPKKNALLNAKKRASYKTPTGQVFRLHRAAKQRAERYGLDFDIELSDIVVPTHCSYLGVELRPGSKGNYANSPSLDRIDNSKGYVKGNIQVISTKANTAKSNLTLDELRQFALAILSKDIV